MLKNITQRILSASINLCACATFPAIASEVQKVSDRWARSPSHNVKMHAAYLTLHNHAGNKNYKMN